MTDEHTGFTHLDAEGRALMVDVSDKEETKREAVAEGHILMKPEVLRAVYEGRTKKGDVLAAGRIAGIMAAKRTGELIPLCHVLPLESCRIEFARPEEGREEADPEARKCLRAVCTAANHGRTGVEMEALTGVSAALLTVYDMCKAMDRGMEIGGIRLLKKSGGRSGLYLAERGKEEGA